MKSSFSDLFHFFFRLVQIDLRSGVLLVFFCRRQEEKVPFYNQSFFVISPVRSNPFPQFFTGSFAVDFGDHLRSRIICGPFWGSFAVSGSFAVGDHLRYCTDAIERCARSGPKKLTKTYNKGFPNHSTLFDYALIKRHLSQRLLQQ